MREPQSRTSRVRKLLFSVLLTPARPASRRTVLSLNAIEDRNAPGNMAAFLDLLLLPTGFPLSADAPTLLAEFASFTAEATSQGESPANSSTGAGGAQSNPVTVDVSTSGSSLDAHTLWDAASQKSALTFGVAYASVTSKGGQEVGASGNNAGAGATTPLGSEFGTGMGTGGGTATGVTGLPAQTTQGATSAAPTTIDTLGWPDAPSSGMSTAKWYERHSVTTTLSAGSVTYALGVVEEATYFVNQPATGGEGIVSGGASLVYTFKKCDSGLPVELPPAASYSWQWDTASGIPPTPPTVDENPFAGSIPDSQYWSKLTVTEANVLLASGAVNGAGIEYQFTNESRDKTTTEIVPGAEVADGTSVSTVRVTGEFAEHFKASDWVAHPNGARQGWLLADNATGGTVAQNQTTTETLSGGITVGVAVDGDTARDATTRTNQTSREYYGTQIDTDNGVFGQVDRVTDATNFLKVRGNSNLSYAKSPGGGNWLLTDGNSGATRESKTFLVRNSSKLREDFTRGISGTPGSSNSEPSSSAHGFSQVELATTAGISKIKESRNTVASQGVVTVDTASNVSDSTRHNFQDTQGSNTYWDRRPQPSGGTRVTDGVSRYHFTSNGEYTDDSTTLYDFLANSIDNSEEATQFGTVTRSTSDRGNAVSANTSSTHEYDSAADLAGPFRSASLVVSRVRSDAGLGAVAGGASVTLDDQTDSDTSGSLSGTVSTSSKSHGPRQFTVQGTKKTTFGEGDNTERQIVTGLKRHNGVPQSGTIMSKSILEGKDSATRSTNGTLNDYSVEAVPKVIRSEAVNVNQTWSGQVIDGEELRILTYADKVLTEESLSDRRVKGEYGIGGTVRISRENDRYVTLTTFTPNTQGAQAMVSGKFDNYSTLTQKFTDGKPVTGQFLTGTRGDAEYAVEVDVVNKLDVQYFHTDLEKRNTKTVYSSKTDEDADQQMENGVWNERHTTLDNRSFVGVVRHYDRRIDGIMYHGRVTVGADGKVEDSSPEIGKSTYIKKVGDASYIEQTVKGSRGRGPDTVDEVHSYSAIGSHLTKSDVSTSHEGSTSESHWTDTGYWTTENKYKYRNNAGQRVLYFQSLNVENTGDATSKLSQAGPSSSYESKGTQTTRYRLVANTQPGAAPGTYSGTLVNYRDEQLETKNGGDSGWQTAIASTSGTLTPQPVSTSYCVAWFEDTWVNDAWSMYGDTWAVQGANWAWSNGQDLVMIGVGLLDTGFGIVMSMTGYGFVAGVPLAAYGIDQIITGSMNMRYGRVGVNLSAAESAVHWATGSETAAILVPAMSTIGLAGLGRLSARSGTMAGTIASGFGINPFNMARVEGAPVSEVVRGLYLSQASSLPFSVKLIAHNIMSMPKIFVGGSWRWVTPQQVLTQLRTNTQFESVRSMAFARIDRINGQFIFQHPEALGWYSRGTAQHELLHLGQYIRSPNITEGLPWRYIHEVLPNILGPFVPNTIVAVSGGSLVGYFLYEVRLMFLELHEAFVP